MASITLRGDTYYLELFDAKRSPKRKRVSLRTSSHREATRLKHYLEGRYLSGTYDPWEELEWETTAPYRPDLPSSPATQPPARPFTLREGADAFLLSRCACRPATVQQYRMVIGFVVRFFGEDAPVEVLTRTNVTRWLASLTCGAQSKLTYVQRVGIFCRFLIEEGHLTIDPTKKVALPRIPDKLASKLMTESHLEAFCQVASRSEVPYMADLVTVAFDLALRRKEVAALRVGWVDFERGLLTLKNENGFVSKTGAEVVKPIVPRSMEILKRRCQGKSLDQPVFVNTLGRPLLDLHRLSRNFTRLARKAQLPQGLTLHSARHGGISRVMAGGASVEAGRRFAGHATTAMLMRYVHLHDEQYTGQILEALQAG